MAALRMGPEVISMQGGAGSMQNWYDVIEMRDTRNMVFEKMYCLQQMLKLRYRTDRYRTDRYRTDRYITVYKITVTVRYRVALCTYPETITFGKLSAF